MIINSAPLSGFILTVWSYVLHPKGNGTALLAGCFPNLIDQKRRNNYSMGTTGGHMLTNALQTLTILSIVVVLSSLSLEIKLIGSVP